jgi:serine/threonine-protein kinase
VFLPPGTRIGSYQIVSLLGSGGMGDVYRARDERLRRDVAVKVMREALAGRPDAHARFLREARSVAALNHPDIVTVHEIGEGDNGEPFIAFELIEGETLDDRLARGPLSPAEVIALALEVSDGLAHAHDAGVLHRDLKPANIMLRPDGRVKILDFGIGKFLADPAVQSVMATATGHATVALTDGEHLVGTAGYMAPEQVRGEPVDSRCDQFAFGIVLYEALTGTQPFTRSSMFETLSAVLYIDPEPLALLCPPAPPTLRSLVHRCLQKSPSDRYSDMRAIAHDLRKAQSEASGAAAVHAGAGPIAPATPDRRVSRRSRWLAVPIVAALVLALFAGRSHISDLFGGGAPVSSGQAERSRLVVLPFTNIGGDPGAQAFVDGTVEVLTSRLTQLDAFERHVAVVPATEVRGERVSSPRDARRRLGATIAVSGSVQRSGDAIRVTVTVIDPRTQQQLAGRIVDGRREDVLALQDAVVLALSEMLRIELQPKAQELLTAGGSAMPGAYDLYVQGRGVLQRYDQRVSTLDAAIALFEQAARVDERFALSYAALGEALWRKYDLTGDVALVEPARRAALRAVQLNPAVAQVHMTLGIVQRGTGQYEEALRAFDQGRVLNAPRAQVYREVALTYEALRRYPDAEATYLKGIAERPDEPSLHSRLGAFYAARGAYDKAAAQFERVLQLTPENARAASNLGGTYLYLKRFAAAEQQFRRSVDLEPSDSAYSNLGTLYYQQRRFAQAADAYEQAVRIRDTDRRVRANLADAYEMLEDRVRARASWLRAATLAEQQLQIDPRRADVIADLSFYRAALGNARQARRLAREAVRIAPRDARVLFRAATTSAQLQDRTTAADLVIRALDAGMPAEQVLESDPLAPIRELPNVQARLARP